MELSIDEVFSLKLNKEEGRSLLMVLEYAVETNIHDIGVVFNSQEDYTVKSIISLLAQAKVLAT